MLFRSIHMFQGTAHTYVPGKLRIYMFQGNCAYICSRELRIHMFQENCAYICSREIAHTYVPGHCAYICSRELRIHMFQGNCAYAYSIELRVCLFDGYRLIYHTCLLFTFFVSKVFHGVMLVLRTVNHCSNGNHSQLCLIL